MNVFTYWVHVLLLVTLVACGQPPKGKDSEIMNKVRQSGLIVSSDRQYTYWKVPLGAMGVGETRQSIDAIVKEFSSQIVQIEEKFKSKGIDPNSIGLDTEEIRQEAISAMVNQIVEKEITREVYNNLGENSEIEYEFRKTSNWKRYLIPHALVLFAGGKVSLGAIAKGGITATVMIILQPWKMYKVNNHTGEIVEDSLDLEVGVAGIPNLSIGVGAGAETTGLFGVGVISGPLNSPSQVRGFGVGVSAHFGLITGGFAQAMVLLGKPPLLLSTIGIKLGITASAGMEAEGAVILSLDELIEMFQGTLL